ncbi:origin recognition complex subunit 1-like [Hylaeus volcanicus]|uniref:origin recognition complex subunit 1-like n=1 Tax=Hylaeus volcanicus TaxID=313075 RepID=UPI0023B7C82F|nr:origin recognition complex subunit 1-like [Hylaeus volcanicus]
MASKMKKYSDCQIAAILDAESDSDTCKEINNGPSKLQKRRNSKLNDSKEDSSDAEVIFNNVKKVVRKNSITQKESVSLRIKLRRSTEQSLYKSYLDSDCRKSRNKLQSKPLKQKKKNHLEVESDESFTNSKDSSITTDSPDKTELVTMQNENEVLPRTRIRKRPLKFSSYHCGSLDSICSLENPPVNSPSLRNRKNINYNENTLLINAIKSSLNTDRTEAKQKENKDINVSRSVSRRNSKSNTLKSNLRNTKRRYAQDSIQDSKSDSSTDIEEIKIKSLKQSNHLENKIDDKLNQYSETKEIINEHNLSTSVRGDKEKGVVSKKIQKSKGNCDKEIWINAENTPASINSINNINNFNEEECLADLYKCIKISSPKKKVLTPQKKNNVQKSIEVQLQETHLSTPKSRSIKCSSLTPSLRKRNSTLLKPSTPLQEARSRLHVSAVPKSLPCREEEFNNIFTFLKGKLEDKSGGCIYISGVPGTGKTATVNEAVRCLQKLIIKDQIDDFDYIAINGMKLTEPRQAYVQILKQLDGKFVTWEQAYRILEKRFNGNNSRMTLLLIDELDFLCTKRQDVVYNLLDWPSKATARLIVVTIANTMDLPERVLMGRVTSRLGLTRLTFQPYNYKQLQEIVMSRLKDFNGFRSEAIQLVARKVSAVSGDARRALDICRRAIEIAESRNAETISLQDVTEAVSEMIASAKVQAIKHCSKMEQIFLQAISAEVIRTSIEDVYFIDAYKQLEALCSFDGIKVPTVTEILAVCGRLSASRLLICEHARNDIYQKILLNVSTDDIHYGIQELDFNSK